MCNRFIRICVKFPRIAKVGKDPVVFQLLDSEMDVVLVFRLTAFENFLEALQLCVLLLGV